MLSLITYDTSVLFLCFYNKYEKLISLKSCPRQQTLAPVGRETSTNEWLHRRISTQENDHALLWYLYTCCAHPYRLHTLHQVITRRLPAAVRTLELGMKIIVNKNKHALARQLPRPAEVRLLLVGSG